MAKIQYQAHHPVSRTLLRSVILDFHSYPVFIPQVRSCVVQEISKQEWEITLEIFVIRPLSYRIRMEEKKDGRLVWSLLEGAFTMNHGFWKLEETKTGCNIHYELEIQMSTFLPSIITKKVQETAIPELILSFVEEAQRRVIVQQKNDRDDN